MLLTTRFSLKLLQNLKDQSFSLFLALKKVSSNVLLNLSVLIALLHQQFVSSHLVKK
jgi:hypothetical protein